MAKPKSQSNASSKADTKFEKKLAFYSMVRDRVVTLNAQKSITKKKRVQSRQKKPTKAYNLTSLLEVLPELKDLEKKPAVVDVKVNCKSRPKIMLKEAKQLKTVLSHPTFQSDPLAAIHLHLQTTQPILEKKPEKRDKSGDKDKKKKKSKGKKKSDSSAQAMEM